MLVAILDRSRYMPSGDLRALIEAPGAIEDDLVRAITEYLAEHPELVIKIATVALQLLIGAA